jgi:putative membrane protein
VRAQAGRRSAPAEGHDPGLAGDRTALAWTRSALSIAGAGILIARAAFLAHLWALGVAEAIALAAVALLTYRHGQRIYPPRRRPDEAPARQHQASAFRLLTAATLATAVVAAATVTLFIL